MNSNPSNYQNLDTDKFPNINLPSELYAEEGSTEHQAEIGATTGVRLDVQNLRWDFCILYLGNSWQPLPVYANSPDLAASIVDATVQRLNNQLVQMGYPANSLSWRYGTC